MPNQDDKASIPLYTIVDNDLLPALAEISGYAISVYTALKSFADVNGQCWPSRKAIAQRAGVSVATVRRVVPLLVKQGLITKIRRNSGTGRTSNLYQFVPSPRVTETPGVEPKGHTEQAQGSHRPSPRVTQTHGRTTREEQPLKGERSKRLLELIDGWNSLPPSIASPVRRNPPSRALSECWKRLDRDPELREAFQDIPAIMAAIRKANFCHGKPWFSLNWIFSRNSQTRELRVQQLLNGAFQDNGKQPAKIGSGQQYDPNDTGFGAGMGGV